MRISRFVLSLLLLTGVGTLIADPPVEVSRTLYKGAKIDNRSFELIHYAATNGAPADVPLQFVFAKDIGSDAIWFAALTKRSRLNVCSVWPNESEDSYDEFAKALSQFTWPKGVDLTLSSLKNLKASAPGALNWKIEERSDATGKTFADQSDAIKRILGPCTKMEWNEFILLLKPDDGTGKREQDCSKNSSGVIDKPIGLIGFDEIEPRTQAVVQVRDLPLRFDACQSKPSITSEGPVAGQNHQPLSNASIRLLDVIQIAGLVAIISLLVWLIRRNQDEPDSVPGALEGKIPDPPGPGDSDATGVFNLDTAEAQSVLERRKTVELTPVADSASTEVDCASVAENERAPTPPAGDDRCSCVQAMKDLIGQISAAGRDDGVLVEIKGTIDKLSEKLSGFVDRIDVRVADKVAATELKPVLDSVIGEHRDWLNQQFKEIEAQRVDSTRLVQVAEKLPQLLDLARDAAIQLLGHRNDLKSLSEEIRPVGSEPSDAFQALDRSMESLIASAECCKDLQSPSDPSSLEGDQNAIVIRLDKAINALLSSFDAVVWLNRSIRMVSDQRKRILTAASNRAAKAEQSLKECKEESERLEQEETLARRGQLTEIWDVIVQLRDAGYLDETDASDGEVQAPRDWVLALKQLLVDAELRPELTKMVRGLIQLRRDIQTAEVQGLPHYKASGLPEILNKMKNKSFRNAYSTDTLGDALIGLWREFLEKIFRSVLLYDTYWPCLSDERESKLYKQLKEICEVVTNVMRRYAQIQPHSLTLPVYKDTIRQHEAVVQRSEGSEVPRALESDAEFAERVHKESLSQTVYCDVAYWGFDRLNADGKPAILEEVSQLRSKQPGSPWLATAVVVGNR